MYNQKMKFSLRLLYLYLFSAVGLIIMVVSSIQAVDLGLKSFVFKDIDNYESVPYASPEGRPMPASESAKFEQQNKEFTIRNTKRDRQRQLVNIISMFIIGLPLYLYHWKTIQKENV